MPTADTAFHTFPRTIDVPITEQRVRDLLCTAFEGGMYWCDVAGSTLREDLTIEDFKEGGSEANKVGEYFPSFYLVPFVEGCSLTLRDHEDDAEYTLDAAAMKRGLEIMAAQEPRHFDDFMAENDDAITAYVWLQCCCLGEVVYG